MANQSSKDIRMAHLVNLMSIAYADGEVTEKENETVVNIAEELGLTDDDFNQCVEYWQNTDEEDIPIAVPENEADKAKFMLNFLQVMSMDGKVSEEEISFLKNIADKFGLNDEEFRDMVEGTKALTELSGLLTDELEEVLEDLEDDEDEEELEMVESLSDESKAKEENDNSSKEKQVRMLHLVNLMSIAYADGDVTEREVDLLRGIAQDLELTDEDFDNCFEYWKKTDEAEIPIAVPDDEDEEIAFLKNFTLMMIIDGEIEEKEKEYLARVAEQFGYNAEKVVPQLIDIVYDEHFGGQDEEEEDELLEDVFESQIGAGKADLSWKNIEEAFDELFLASIKYPEAFEYFHIIPGIDTRLFRITPKQLEIIQKAADKGYAVAHYVLGRYHQVVQPDEDSHDKAQQYLESAAKGGIPDAQWALAMRYLNGYLGPITYEKFNNYIEEAINNGSMMALRQQLYDTIHGEHGQKADPKTTIKSIEAFMAQNEDNSVKYAYMYDLLGDAYRKVGNKDKADGNYEKAEDNGYFESGAKRFLNKIEGPDKDFYRNTLSVFLNFSCDNKDPNSFLTRALEHAYHYDTEKKEDKKETLAKKLREDLETAYNLGLGDAAYYLGLYSYEGSYGFEKNVQEAWNWFNKGQHRESGLAFAGMAKMIEDGVKPSDLPDNYLLYCQLCAVRRGIKEMAPAVVDAYKAGQLDALAEEVEKVYIPMTKQGSEKGEIPTVIIVNAKGEAIIYKVEKEEWAKLPQLIGAKRLAPVRVDALDKLGQKAGLNDRLVAWIDIDAPRKGLPENPTATKFYKGIIAGNIVFSLADKLFDPMPFYGVEEAEAVAKALKAKVKEVVTDLSKVKATKNKPADYSKVNPTANTGYVARIEPDGKAHIVSSGLGVFALFEEDIYDPVRLKKLYDLGTKLELKGHLTLWTDNSALKKQLNWNTEITPNPIGAKWYPGPVADNIFVALEDENYRMMLFDDPETLKKTCAALGVKTKNIIVQ